MKIALAVFGRFHIFNTAEEFSRNGVLNQFFTAYPDFIVNKYKINNNNVDSYTYSSLYILNRIHSKIFKYKKSNVYLRKIFDKLIAKKIHKNNDFYIAWGGYSYDSICKAKELGITVVLERGSAHPLYIDEILKEEFKKNSLTYKRSFEDLMYWDLKTIEMADYISVPSLFAKRSYVDMGISEKRILVNPYGVDLSGFKQIDKKDKVFRIIYAGGATLQKGYHYLLQAFYELDLPDCELWHLGSLNDEIKPFLKKYRHRHFILKGHKPQNELYKYYSQCNVFVLPSIQDGFGMVLTQAMACGLPFIATKNTGGEDLLTKEGDEGFIIPIRDVEALKAKILYLYNNQDVAYNMGVKAKQKISQGFTWEDYGKRYLNNLKDIS
jgi:glycosyltransferase involved in cell wall biosynthesis